MIRAGIDIRAAETQVVLIGGQRILCGTTVETSPDAISGAVAALQQLLTTEGISPSSVAAVMIGTSMFEETLSRRGGLTPVAAVRLCLPTTASLPPMADWPADLRAATGGHWYLTHGGQETNGRRISALSEQGLARIAADIRAKQVGAVALSSVFAPPSGGDEAKAAEILSQHLPDTRIVQSGTIGSPSLLAREGTAILNLSLREVTQRRLGQLALALASAGLVGPLFLVRGDGTLMDAASAVRQPVQTFGSGAANAITGAGWLYGQTGAIVIELDQWRLTAGLLHDGLPRPGHGSARFGGLRLAAPHAEVIALPLTAPPDRQMLLDIAASLSADTLPVVLVGKEAGRVTLPARLTRRGPKPAYYALARAIGAAVAPVSGRADRIYPLGQFSTESARADARQRATQAAIAAGARADTVTLHHMTEQPLPDAMLRIRAVALGQPDAG